MNIVRRKTVPNRSPTPISGSLLRILNESATNQSKLIAAERDLNVYKQVYDDLQHRFKELESSKALVEKQRDELEKASFPSIFLYQECVN